MFKLYKEITNKKEKAIFHEEVRFISQMIKATAKLYNFNLDSIEADENIASIELIDMGIIRDITELEGLNSFIKKEYQSLIHHLTIYHTQKENWEYILKNFSNSYRKKCIDFYDQQQMFTIADFFGGAGGLSLGFNQAGFKTEFVNEIDPLAIQTYKYNHPEVDSSKIVADDIKNIIDDLQNYIGNKMIDVVIGGPPCQSFSSANQQRIIDDPRNELYKYFIQAVKKIKPKFVVMENVKGMKKVAQQVIEDFRSIKVNINGEVTSYDVDFHIFNSEDFSVAQRRERLIYFAVRNDIAKANKVTPQKIIDEIISSTIVNERFILRDALEYLRPLKANSIRGNNEVDSNEFGYKVDINNYFKFSNNYLDIINNNKKFKYVYNHKARFLNETNYEVYRLLEQGDDATDPKVAHVMPYSHRNHVFKDKYYKLIENKPSRTITAHLTMDGHSHIHPTQIRSLTPREAARIQSFPDDFVFFGPYLKTFTQIGNAVPPLMAKGFAKIIKRYLC